MLNQPPLRRFLNLSYDELEELNREANQRALDPKYTAADLRDYYCEYLRGESRIKAVTICFSDLEGRFHMLDYDKKFLLDSYNNLTFDGSSVRGFSAVDQSDLLVDPDWGSLRWLPSDIFGPGKVIVFGMIKDRDGSYYHADMRAQLKLYIESLKANEGYTTNVSVECEGFLLNGLNAEQNYNREQGFSLVSTGGYFHSLPRDPLRQFIDAFADAQRAMAFENEKDHPEVAPSQFELNYKYCDALAAGDRLQLYKLLARQVAANMGMTACFLPKPIAGLNGNGMHCNLSLSQNGKNIFYGGEAGTISDFALGFVERLLTSANDICLVLNPSVNAYRRIDPKYEAPNQIKYSSIDRTSMVRIPWGNEKSARIEVRTVAPDANPYMAFLTILKTGLMGPQDASADSNSNGNSNSKRARTRFIPDKIDDAIRHFKGSELITTILGPETKEKFIERKLAAAHRCPRELGNLVKEAEIHFHHEVTNQYLWSKF